MWQMMKLQMMSMEEDDLEDDSIYKMIQYSCIDELEDDPVSTLFATVELWAWKNSKWSCSVKNYPNTLYVIQSAVSIG